MTKYLLESVDVDTDGDAVDADGAHKNVSVWGTDFGGGTVKIEARVKGLGATWTVLNIGGSPIAITSNEIVKVDYLAIGMELRATLTGSTNPNNVNAFLL